MDEDDYQAAVAGFSVETMVALLVSFGISLGFSFFLGKVTAGWLYPRHLKREGLD